MSPDNFSAYFNRAMLYKFSSKIELAINDFDSAIKIKTNFIDAYQNRAVLRAQLKNKDAILDFNKVIELNPESGESYYNRAVYCINFKIEGDYCKDLKKAFQLNYYPAMEILSDECSKSK